MRQTSIRAYHTIKEDGTLTKLQQLVADYVKAAGPVTGRTISKAISGGHKRLSDLEKLGIIATIGTRKDEITGKNVLLWVTTGQQPLLAIPKIKRKSRKELENGVNTSQLYDTAYLKGVRDCLQNKVPKDIMERV